VILQLQNHTSQYQVLNLYNHNNVRLVIKFPLVRIQIPEIPDSNFQYPGFGFETFLVTIEILPRLRRQCLDATVRCCGVVGSTLAFGSIGHRSISHGLKSAHRLFSHHSASAFSTLRSLAKCSLNNSVRRLL